MKQCTCKKCGYTWNSRTDNPKACPACKRYDWNKDSK
jgi:predicted Zn-ribbon and HTH transcriptional regulator